MSNRNVNKLTSEQEVFSQMLVFKDTLKYIDVVLIAVMDNERVSAHRLLLASRSTYFHTLFKSSWREQKKSEIRLKNISGSILKNIVEYCYSGKIGLGEDNVEMIFAKASLFKLTDLLNTCCDFMATKMTTVNCWEFWTLAEKHNCPYLVEKTKKYICDHFMDVYKRDQFLTVDNRRLRELLASDELAVTSENEIFLSLIRWLRHEQRERGKYISDLLSLVRVPFLSPTFVIEHKDFIVDSVGVQAFIKEIFQWHVGPTEMRPAIQIRPRKWVIETLLVVVTGSSGGIIPIETYCQESDKWTAWITILQEQERVLFGVAMMGTELITAGGRSVEHTPVNTVMSISTITTSSKVLKPMEKSRESVTLVALGDNIYAIGGCDGGGNWFNSVERWNRWTCTWCNVAPMIENKRGQNAAALNGCIYVIGESAISMECYNPATNSWTEGAPMHEDRQYPGVAVLNGYLYAIGGIGSKTVERYDSNSNTWTMMCPMSSARFGMGCIALNNRIIAAGGWNNGDLSIVEEYNPITNVWTLKSKLYVKGVCVIVRASDIFPIKKVLFLT